MFNVSNVTTSSTKASKFVIPFSVNYTQNGVKKSWDLIRTHSSVSVVIYNVTRKVLVFVKQFRPGVYINAIPEEDRKGTINTTKYPSSLGVTIELCAGIVDKTKSLEEIAQDEILEECGYEVSIDNLKKVKTYRASVGFAGAKQTLFYTEVTDSMKVQKGGGVAEEGEFIEILEMCIPEAKTFLNEESVNASIECIWGLQWFFGGGRMDDGELIEIVEMSLLETKKYMEEDNINSPPGFLAGLFWFFINKNPKV